MCRANAFLALPAPPAPNTVSPRARLQRACCASPSMRPASPTLDAWETSSRRRILHASHHGLPTSGGGHKRAKKGTFDPALLARLKILGITCFGLFRGPVALVALCWYRLSTRALRTVADKAYHTTNTTHAWSSDPASRSKRVRWYVGMSARGRSVWRNSIAGLSSRA